MITDILHITTDEKFIDSIHDLFEKAFPDKNRFIVLVPQGFPRLRFIQNTKDVELLIKKGDFENLLLEQCNKSKVVFFHGMNEVWAKLILRSKNTENYIYMVWGAEIYLNPLLYKKELYGKQTKALKFKVENSFSVIERLKQIYRKFKYPDIVQVDNKKIFEETKKALSKISRVGILFKGEFELYKKIKIIPNSAVQHKLSYYPLEFFVKKVDTNQKPGNNIWIGNSSALSNNHLEVFDILSHLNIDSRKIIVPLSYGSRDIAKIIERKGKKMFGNNFTPLKDFMPLEKYSQKQQSAGIVIMNQYRQQAVGNILSAVYFGSKVFLNQNNMAFHYLKRIGCSVFLIDKDLKEAIHNPSILNNLTDIEIKNNRRILENEIGEKALITELRKGLFNFGIK